MIHSISIGALRVALATPDSCLKVLGAIGDFASQNQNLRGEADLFLQVVREGEHVSPQVNDIFFNYLKQFQDANSRDAFELIFDSGGLYRIWRMYDAHFQDGLVIEVFNQAQSAKVPYLTLLCDFNLKQGLLHVAKNLYAVGETILPLVYPLDEILWIQLLARHHGFILHAFSCVNDGNAWAFAGVSGAGKTTLSRLFREHLASPVILSDDRVIVRAENAGLMAHGTPWHGEDCIWNTTHAPLKSVIFLEHGKVNRLTRLNNTEALTGVLLRSFPTLYSVKGMEMTLETMAQLIHQVPCYTLQSVPNRDLLQFFEREMGLGLSNHFKDLRSRAELCSAI